MLMTVLAALLPFIGAQVFIEPGQTEEQTEQLFETLEDSGMTACRIRMFESYMRQEDGTWDFSLFDPAFDSAQKHGVGIWCTFFPATSKTDIGGWKFPYDQAQQDSFAEFIKALVTHYKDHPALKGWVLINEPGIGELPDSPFIDAKYAEWKAAQPVNEFKPNGYPVLMDTSESRFIYHINTDFLGWIAQEVRKYDDAHDIHVNPHAVFDNFAQYNFPAYRTFLTSLGGSAHPAWHFSYFNRDEYAFAMMAQSEILRSGAGELPWFMTEIQGGNNTWSGGHALCPTKSEITQWLWAILGCGAKGGIFWMLNPRASGIEAGEWAMVDFQGKPSDRLVAASETAAVLNQFQDMFATSHEAETGVDILYFRNSYWAERLMARKDDDFEGRRPGAVAKSTLGCFRALSETGLNVGIKAFEEYDFSRDDFSGKTIILSDQISVPDSCVCALKHFVEEGGTLIAEGLTGYFDEDLHCTMTSGFKLADLLGGEISEYILEDEFFDTKIDGISLPTHLWKGIFADDASPVKVTRSGKGKVVWVPSCIGLGAWCTKEFKPLAKFLLDNADVAGNPVRFTKYQKGMLLRTLESEDGQILVCINKSGKSRRVRFAGTEGKPEVIFSDNSKKTLSGVKIGAEGTIVIKYTR